MDRTVRGIFMGYVGRQSATVAHTQTHRVDSICGHGGSEAFSPNGVHRSGRPADCPQRLHVRTQRVHGTIEAESTRGQGTIEVTIEVWVS